jgi:hypothetical protein
LEAAGKSEEKSGEKTNKILDSGLWDIVEKIEDHLECKTK